MATNSSHETSWADQWDYNSDPIPAAETKKGAGAGAVAAKYGQKTKAVASTGAKKVKEGTTAGFRWIKDKCHKTTQKT